MVATKPSAVCLLDAPIDRICGTVPTHPFAALVPLTAAY
jgi:hypothetical protein